MRRIAFWAIVIVVTALTLLLRATDSFYSMSTTLISLVVLLTLLPPLSAAYTWPPRGVIVTAVAFLLLVASTYYVLPPWSNLERIVGILLAVDALAVVIARWRYEAIRRGAERDSLAEMGQALAERQDLAKFAELVSVSGQWVMGPGTMRLWVVDRQHKELRLVQRGDHDLFGDSANAGMFLTDLDRVRLDAPDPRARAVQLAQPVEAIKGQGLRWVAKASLSERLRNGGSGWSGPVMAIDFEWLKIFGGLNKQYALLAEPVRWHREIIGVLTYERVTRPSNRFTAHDRSGLAAIAALCAAAIATRQPLALATA